MRTRATDDLRRPVPQTKVCFTAGAEGVSGAFVSGGVAAASDMRKLLFLFGIVEARKSFCLFTERWGDRSTAGLVFNSNQFLPRRHGGHGEEVDNSCSPCSLCLRGALFLFKLSVPW